MQEYKKNSNIFRVATFGKTGAGKSFLLNHLMGIKKKEDFIFGVGDTLQSESDHVETHIYKVPEKEVYINFTDTVGFGDNRPNITDFDSFAQMVK